MLQQSWECDLKVPYLASAKEWPAASVLGSMKLYYNPSHIFIPNPGGLYEESPLYIAVVKVITAPD